MNEDRKLFQQSVIPASPLRPSWRKALGWGALFGDVALAATLPAWRPGCLVLPVCALLFITKKRERGVGSSGDAQFQATEKGLR